MSKVDLTLLDPFFGGDERGRLFARIFTQNFTVFDSSIDFTTPVATPAYNRAKEIVFAEFHENKQYTDGSAIADNAIHFEFLNFIGSTAHFHHELNKEVDASGSKKRALKAAMDKALAEGGLIAAFYNAYVDSANHSVKFDEFKKIMPLIDATGEISILLNNGNITKEVAGHIIYYMTTWGNDKSLRTFYKTIATGGVSAPVNTGIDFSVTPFNMRLFTVKVDKVFRKRLLALKSGERPMPGAVTEFKRTAKGTEETYVDMITGSVWMRDDKADLYTKDDKGNKIYEKDYEMSLGTDCATTDFTGPECKAYLLDCLLSGDGEGISQCVKFWEDDSNWGAADVAAIHPKLAVRTLQRFGFRTRRVVLPDGQQVKLVESVDSWKKNYLETKFKDNKEVQSIFKSTANKKIAQYLQLVVDHVNKNPAILNKDYKPYTAPTKDEMSKSKLLQKLQVVEDLRSKIHQNSLSYGVFIDLSSNLNTPPFMLESNLFNLGGLNVQFGGNSNFGSYISRKLVPQHGGHKKTSDVLASLYSEFKSSLAFYKKTIDAGSDKIMTDKLAALKALESENVELIKLINEYKSLVQTYGTKNTVAETISFTDKTQLEGLIKGLKEKLEKEKSESLNITRVLEGILTLGMGSSAPGFERVGEVSEITSA